MNIPTPLPLSSQLPKSKPIFLLSFFKRYWKMITVFVFFVLVSKRDEITYAFGPLFYLFMIGIGVAVVVMLLKHMMFKNSLDTFTQDNPSNPEGQSDFVITWRALPANEKLKYTIHMLMVLFGGMCWIAASIAK